MKKALLELLPRRIRLSLGCLLLPFYLVSCANVPTLTRTAQDFGHAYRPTNVYLRAKDLPVQFRRVAVLPLTISSHTTLLEDGVESLESILHSELVKCKRFEIVTVTGTQLSQWTGQTGWRIDEALPATLLARVREATGCDAVIFCQLTRYQPYQPLAIGWKFNLIESPETTSPSAEGLKAQTLWSVDELLDAGDPAVANGARAYYMQHLHNEVPLPDASTVLSSPTRFGQYTLSALLATLPERPQPK